MSDVTNNQNTVADDYFGGGSKYTLKAGVNKNVKVKSWSIESNERDGKTSYYLKLTYEHYSEGVEDRSTINELLNFPKPYKGRTDVEKNSLRYGFINPLRGFIENFVSEEQTKARFIAVLEKLGVKDFTLSDVDVLNDQLKVLVKAWFDLAEKSGLFSLEGVLVCGYGKPKLSNGEMKQFLTPAKYGQSGCYLAAFRTNGSEELPAEKTTGFKDESDEKYNYWSYTRSKTEVTTDNAPATDTGGW